VKELVHSRSRSKLVVLLWGGVHHRLASAGVNNRSEAHSVRNGVVKTSAMWGWACRRWGRVCELLEAFAIRLGQARRIERNNCRRRSSPAAEGGRCQDPAMPVMTRV
jgi:hypothetical protein